MASDMNIDDVIGQAMGETPEPEITVEEPELTQKPSDPIEGEAAPTTEELIEEALSAPDKWSGFSKTKFALLPKDVQKELVDYHKSVEAQQKVYNALDETIGEHKQSVIATYGSVEGMFKHYMQLDQFAAQDPVGLVKWFCQQRGINPQTLFGQQSAPLKEAASDAPKENVEITPLIEQQVEQRFALMQAQNMIADFEKNTEKYPYFNDVRTVMGQLITSGQAKDMDSAYNKAIRLDDNIWTQLQAQKTQKTSEDQQKATQRAKQAATIKSAPGLSSGSKANGVDLDSIIRETMAARV